MLRGRGQFRVSTARGLSQDGHKDGDQPVAGVNPDPRDGPAAKRSDQITNPWSRDPRPLDADGQPDVQSDRGGSRDNRCSDRRRSAAITSKGEYNARASFHGLQEDCYGQGAGTFIVLRFWTQLGTGEVVFYLPAIG